MDFSITPAKPIESVAPTPDEVAVSVEGQPAVGPDATPAAGAGSATPHADQASALVHGGFVERVLGEMQSTLAALPAQGTGERADKTVETNTAQTFARPQVPQSELPRHIDANRTQAVHGHADFALPAAQLVPAALIGLQVDHPTLWPMTRGFDPDLAPAHQTRVGERDARDDEWNFYDEDDTSFDDAPPQDEDKPGDTAVADVVVDAPEEAWCAALGRALRVALAARVLPQALVVADEQWRRGRCVVLACPQGTDPAAAAWAFVLWPRRSPHNHTLSFHGARIEARLAWSRRPGAGTWLHARVMKQHHPRTGRQLVPASAETTTRVPCEVQLGPVLARTLKPCDVCLKVGAVRRLWNALGSQWSVHVVVSASPLLDASHDAPHATEEVSR